MCEKPSPRKEFLCGLGAAFTTIGTTYPVTKLIYRQIIDGTKAYGALMKIRREGLHYLYRGILPPLTQKSISLSIMFGVYCHAKEPLKKFKLNEYLDKLIGAVLSGATETIFMPFERIQILLVDSKYHGNFKNMQDAFHSVRKQYGVKEYYRGLNLLLIRNCMSNSIFFIVKDEGEKRIKKPENVCQQTLVNFGLGSLFGAGMSTLFYPLKVLKVKIHTQLGGEFKPIYKVAKIVYHENGGGIRNFYQGVIVNVSKAFLAWGITNTSYEFFKKIL